MAVPPEEEIARKRREIEKSESRIEYHRRMMEERPELARMYEYWLHYHITRRAEWLTRLWLEELRDIIKPEVRRGVTRERAREIRDYLAYIESEIASLLEQLLETRRLAEAREWGLRYPEAYPTMARWISSVYGRLTPIRGWMREIERELPPVVVWQLARIKIRLYNEVEKRPESPVGMFQCFYDVDAFVDTETGIIDWDWWLTSQEVDMAKHHMVGYFKGMAKWNPPDQVGLAYFMETEGIPYREHIVSYKRKKIVKPGEPYAKNVPARMIEMAESLTVEQLILGIASKAPEPIDTTLFRRIDTLEERLRLPYISVTERYMTRETIRRLKETIAERMGLFFERAMIIDEDGEIKWDEIRDEWIWHPSEEDIQRIKEELKER